MSGDPTSDGNQLHGEELYLDSIADAINRLQEDGGIAPEIIHQPTEDVDAPPPCILRRRSEQEG